MGMSGRWDEGNFDKWKWVMQGGKYEYGFQKLPTLDDWKVEERRRRRITNGQWRMTSQWIYGKKNKKGKTNVRYPNVVDLMTTLWVICSYFQRRNVM